MNSQSATSLREAPIGVFDSGVGGLTVLRALQTRLPDERFVYLGDTARLPYGTKSPETIIRYSLQAAAYLMSQGIKCLVVACNTASAAALDVLRAEYPDLPLVGVVEPGAAAGCKASRNGRIVVIATEGTVKGGAYQRAIGRIRADAEVLASACPLFVALAEEGWVKGPIVEAIARRYLGDVFDGEGAPDTLLLGCTHFPVLRDVLAVVAGVKVTIVDSAATTAIAVAELLEQRDLLVAHSNVDGSIAADASVRFLATDGRERFARVAAYFLERSIAPEAVEVIDPSFTASNQRSG